MKLLNTAIEALRRLFRNKPSAQPPSSGESAMLDALCNSPYMDHDTVNRLSRLYFNCTIPNGPYRFCAGSPYGLLLHADNVDVHRNESGGLEDIVLQLKDITLTHSLRVSISVQEFNEILEPVQLSAQLRPRGDSDCKVTL